MKPLRSRLTYANVTATLALFVALGGGAYAAATIDSGDVVDNSLRSVDVKDDTLKGRDIDDGTVGGTDVRDGTLGTKDVANGSLGGNDVADDSLTSRDVANLADSGGIVKLSAGDTVTLLRKGSLSLVASCTLEDEQTGAMRLKVLPHSTEEGTLADFGGSVVVITDETEIGAGEDGEGFDASGSSYLLAAPSGETLAGRVESFVHAFDADCAALATGEGGNGVRDANP
jgi:hypothetical protein